MKSVNLNKDQKQKLILSLIGCAVLLYCYFSFFLGPLNTSRDKATKDIATLQAKIDASKGEMKKAEKLEQQAKDATTRYAAIKQMSPEGAPIAWFPPRMKTFFANQKIEKTTARLESSFPFKQPELADFVRTTWIIDLQQAEFATVGAALAALENAEPLFIASKISIHASPEDPQYQQTTLTLATTLLKR